MTDLLLLEKDELFLSSFALAGALGGVVHGATIDWNVWAGGWGGKAGTCAFIGCLAFRFLSKIVSTMTGVVKSK